MKTKTQAYGILTKAVTAEIVIDKNGMRVINKSEPCSDSEFYRNHLTNLINLDGWKYSWHMDVSKAVLKNSEERKKIRQILKEKIADREKEIVDLKNGLQILGKWKLGLPESD